MSRESAKTLAWFNDSPDAGDPRCICSYCSERIEQQAEGEDDFLNDYEGEPIRMWDGANGEMRFHQRCFNECLSLGLLNLPK